MKQIGKNETRHVFKKRYSENVTKFQGKDLVFSVVF